MFNGSLDYTICSTDPEHYNKINCNLTSPMTKYESFIVTGLTANFDLVVLNKEDYLIYDDYIEENDAWIRYEIRIKNEYKAMSRETALSCLRLEICPEFEEPYIRPDDEEEEVETPNVAGYKIENIITDTAGRYL